MTREISAGAIIFRKVDGKPMYLLLHYASGHWDFVKGHIEPGEEELATVKRETKEETGITELTFNKNFNDRIRYFFKRGKTVVYKEVVFFLAETNQEKVIISHEHIGFTWLSYEDAMRQLTFENARNMLRKANDALSKV